MDFPVVFMYNVFVKHNYYKNLEVIDETSKII